MTPEIKTMIDEIKAMRRLRQHSAAHCITHGIVTELPRCQGCGELVPWCDCVDPMDYREAREPVRYVWQDGKPEIY